MKVQIFRITRVCAVVSFLFCEDCGVQKNSPAELYRDPQYGFRIARPDSGWILTDETGIPGVLVIIKSETIAEDFIPNVTIAIEKLPGMMTAIEYGEMNQESLAGQGFEILSGGKIVISRNTFYELKCLNRHSSPSTQFQHLCLVKNQTGFIITCTALEKDYAAVARDFEFIVKSFEFL